jgi:hypothetical protein
MTTHMTEGWYGDEHLILFDGAEVAAASERYAISQFLPNYRIIGLRGWNYFILQDSGGRIYSVASVPIVAAHLSPYALPSAGSRLMPDDRFTGKIKWYVTPTVFGGDPKLGENVIWVSHEQHAQLVRWWNGLCRSVTTVPASTIGSEKARVRN